MIRTVLWFALYVAAVLLLIWVIESDVVFWTALALAGGVFVYGIWRTLRRSPLQHNLHQLAMLRDLGHVSASDYARMRQELLDGRPAKEVFASLRLRG